MSNTLTQPNSDVKRKIKLMKFGINLLTIYKDSIRTTEKRLNACEKGCRLLILFLASTALAIACILPGYFGLYPFAGNFFESMGLWLTLSLVIYFVELYIFWKGIIILYFTSQQIGIKWRGWGLACGMVPVAHLVMLFVLLITAMTEIKFERAKLRLNQSRKDQQICKTKYPILLVHGVFFRDSKLLDYWGRIPDELRQNGALIFYGHQDSSSSIMDSAQKLAKRIKEIIQETGCEKINIIAHSKGGLDARAAIATQGIAQYVASLTTINTPHRGCAFVDYLLKEFSQEQIDELADTYNTAALTMGDDKPDFITAISDLTKERCQKFNEEIKDDPNIYYQSVGSIMNAAFGGHFPLNFSYGLVKSFDGPNDGLVGSDSPKWGEKFQLLTVKGKRGISHGDMIDLNRENIPGFDVREFYVQLVSDLKSKGF